MYKYNNLDTFYPKMQFVSQLMLILLAIIDAFLSQLHFCRIHGDPQFFVLIAMLTMINGCELNSHLVMDILFIIIFSLRVPLFNPKFHMVMIGTGENLTPILLRCCSFP